MSIDRGRTRINITAYTGGRGRPCDRSAAFEIDLPRQIGIDLSGEIIAETGKVDDAVDAFEELRIEMPSVPHDEFEQWAGREIAEFFLPKKVAVESEHMITARHEIAAQWNADIAACPSN